MDRWTPRPSGPDTRSSRTLLAFSVSSRSRLTLLRSDLELLDGVTTAAYVDKTALVLVVEGPRVTDVERDVRRRVRAIDAGSTPLDGAATRAVAFFARAAA